MGHTMIWWLDWFTHPYGLKKLFKSLFDIVVAFYVVVVLACAVAELLRAFGNMFCNTLI